MPSTDGDNKNFTWLSGPDGSGGKTDHHQQEEKEEEDGDGGTRAARERKRPTITVTINIILSDHGEEAVGADCQHLILCQKIIIRALSHHRHRQEQQLHDREESEKAKNYARFLNGLLTRIL